MLVIAIGTCYCSDIVVVIVDIVVFIDGMDIVAVFLRMTIIRGLLGIAGL